MILMLVSLPAMAFNQKVDTVVVSHDSSQVLQIIVTIDNTDNEALWIWLDCNDYSRDSRKAIRRYLMKRRGDFSIFDIATDPNMTGQWWNPSAPLNCFVKYLEPGNTFTFVFYLDKVAKDDYLDCNKKISDIRIFSNQQINEACPGLGTLYGIKRISYPHNVIAFPMESEGLVTTVPSLLSQ